MLNHKFIAIIAILIFFTFSTHQLNGMDTSAAYQSYTQALVSLKNNKLEEAIVFFSKANKLYQSSNSVLYGYSAFYISEIYNQRAQYQQAIEVLKKLNIQQFSKTTASALLHAEYYNRFASLHIMTGNITEAKKILLIAYQQISKSLIKNPALSFKILTNLGTCFETMKDYSSSLQYYHKALSLKPYLTKNLFSVVVLYQYIGKIHYFTGNIDSARFYFFQSETSSQKITPENPVHLASFYSNLGVFYKNIGLLDKALEFYLKSEEILIKKIGSENPFLNNLFTNIGNIYLLQGDYQHASEYFLKSLQMINAVKTSNPISKITILKNLADAHFYVKEYDKGYKFLRESLEIYNKIKAQAKIEFHYYMFARYYLNKGDLQEARKYYLLHLENIKAVYGENSPAMASAYLNYGQFLTTIKDYLEAEKVLNKSLILLKKYYGEKHPSTSQAYSSLGDIFLKTDQLNSARKNFELALGSLNYHNNVKNNSNPLSTSVILILNNLRKISYALKSMADKQKNGLKTYQDALTYLRSSMSIINQLETEYFNQESKLFINAEHQQTLNMAILVCLKLYQMTNKSEYLAEAFKYTEKSKSAVLLSSLKDIQAKIFGSIPKELTDRERKYNEDISIYKELISREEEKLKPDTQLIQTWQNKIFSLNQKKEELFSIYRKKYPAYYQSLYQENIISLKKLQSRLKRKQLLAEYYLNDTLLITFFIDKKSASINIQKADSTFYSNLTVLRQQLSNNKFDDHAFENYLSFVNSAGYLYQKLLGHYKHIGHFSQLLVVPHDILALIPFEVLLTSNNYKKNTPDYRKLDYLIRQQNVVYAYSSTLAFLKLSKHHKKSARTVLAFAPSYNDYQQAGIRALPPGLQSPDMLSPLPGVEEEVNNINKYFRSEIISGKEATESNFKVKANGFSILHLAMHTLVDNENPQYSKLIFSYRQDSIDDGFLNTYELYNLNLNSDLVVLSACNTGFGKVNKGEGVMSLTRGFLYAGCLNIVMTLWPLEDRSGVTIMDNFYKNLKNNRDAGVALYKSKIEYLDHADKLKAHPYFWAAYVTIVNQSSSGSNNYLHWGLLIILAAGSVFTAFMIRRRIKFSL
ncbi:MAG TPA: CHAT domain-containing protein [Bacteroidia bacterium]|nr:CHAT domain-containing protein [Bacteroidia bacterium]HRS59571.1 CHAT domain-containing protein [Bacteroidia bacterium]HRU67640.1 CHAT domain-containing protein [Bacteroidia bacterium]